MKNMHRLIVAGFVFSTSAVLAQGGPKDTGTPEKAETPPTPGGGGNPAQPGGAPTGQSKQADTNEQVATAKFVEAFSTGDWEKAEITYKDLVQSWPAYGKEPIFVYKYAYALFKQNSNAKKDEARLQLEGLLSQPENQDHILAMYLLAQIKASMADVDLKDSLGRVSKHPQWKEDAKEYLLSAARNGFYTLRELKNYKGAEFNDFKSDPKFILKCMQQVQQFDVQQFTKLKPGRNPFELPLPFIIKKGENDNVRVTKDGELSEQQIKDLELQVDAIFQEIDRLVQQQDIDKLTPKFIELQGIMTKYKGIGIQKVQEMLKKWEKRLEAIRDVRIAVQLQIFINEGNEILKAMLKARQAEKFEEVFDGYNQMKSLADRMRKEEAREEFARNADALMVRAKSLNDEAVKLKKIKEFNLIVTGIVVDPRPESRNKAIVVFDDPRGRIYEENDDIRDKDDRKVTGLKVVKILEGSIRFKYEDTEFIRELKQP